MLGLPSVRTLYFQPDVLAPDDRDDVRDSDRAEPIKVVLAVLAPPELLRRVRQPLNFVVSGGRPSRF